MSKLPNAKFPESVISGMSAPIIPGKLGASPGWPTDICNSPLGIYSVNSPVYKFVTWKLVKLKTAPKFKPVANIAALGTAGFVKKNGDGIGIPGSYNKVVLKISKQQELDVKYVTIFIRVSTFSPFVPENGLVLKQHSLHIS